MNGLQGLIVLLVLGIFFAPIILSIVAIAQSSRAIRELRDLKKSMGTTTPAPAAPPPSPPAPALAPTPAPTPVPPPIEKPTVAPPPPPTPRPAAPPPPRTPGPGLEVAIGGKIASFIGVAALVVSVVFFVGYAIQHGWIGPAMRIVMGLAAGGMLVALGHLAEIKGKGLHILARALTGGGAALFYFSVFAAYNIYHLIGPWVAAIGLIASAGAVLALSAVYASQAVAVLGLLGAYLTPLLLRGDFERGLFPLIYVAVVNVPVIALGRRNNWQALLSLAAFFTAVISAVWIEQDLHRRSAVHWEQGLGFAALYYVEFAILGVLRIGMKRGDTARAVDILRLLFASLALLGAIEWVFQATGHADWRGTAYVIIAAAHLGVIQVARRRAGAFKEEVLAFTVIALTFASLALPAELDGAWVSLGWSIEGVLLAWFALRVRSSLLQAGALALGLLGLGKSVLYDVTLFDAPPRLFFNSRFAVGILSSVLLGVQGRLHEISPRTIEPPRKNEWTPALYCLAILAALFVIHSDVFYILPYNDPWTWTITTAAILVMGLGAALASRAGTAVTTLGLLMLVAVPIKIVLVDLATGWNDYRNDYAIFGNPLFFWRLVPAVMAGYCVSRLAAPRGATLFANLASIIATLVVVSAELTRIRGDWSQSLITIWWAISALGLVIVGLVRHRGYLRYCGLAIFGVTVVKVFLVDLSDLSGLQRIAAFFGVGVLMLILSYAYQRVAPMFLKPQDK